ncbi:MAG: imidazoleglycerol-phosphate dehydratase HisB [Opitutae bacterium]|jgi:imidazoleglycerol-phosphate dehydratase|nr:imidazoleglycerol-phosphate dehydratase HisB [Opitutae bacterium]MBT7740371.1 imidazoleglycerol-phosphate dehydratase HisB [Opitutae bacterium]MBT7923044.1 imidazoleglycerol-phosphate dehydratase HisB [Opitutae bacterium]
MENGRIGEVSRETNETCVNISLNLDGEGKGEINTGAPFFDHMLELFARHGFFDLSVDARGDVEVDYHHLVEDAGLALGQAVRKALGDRAGITRYGFFVLPMDETLVTVSLDLSNRPYLVYNAEPPVTFVRDFNVNLFKEFFQAFANEAGANLHVRLEYGEEPHHVVEAVFKGFARALDAATRYEPRLGGAIPSTKGTLSE